MPGTFGNKDFDALIVEALQKIDTTELQKTIHNAVKEAQRKQKAAVRTQKNVAKKQGQVPWPPTEEMIRDANMRVVDLPAPRTQVILPPPYDPVFKPTDLKPMVDQNGAITAL